MRPEAEDVPLPSDEEDSGSEAEVEDSDTCLPDDIEKNFAYKYKIQDEIALTLKKNFILKLDADASFSHVAVGLSDTSVEVLDLQAGGGLKRVTQISALPAEKETLMMCGVRFLDETRNHLLVGTTNGLVRLFDLRSNKEEAYFKQTSDKGKGATVPISSFDRNANSRVLCMGSDQYQQEVFMMFYDLRKKKAMGSYFDCHQNDITALRFHPNDPDTLASGSVDGLVNIFDLTQTDEYDALKETINTEETTTKINWHNISGKDYISCLSHTDFKLYDSEGDEIVANDREAITKGANRRAPENCNIINSHQTADGNIFLLAGTYLNKGEIMRSLVVRDKELQPFATYNGNKQIVRDSLYCSNADVLITAGEGSVVTLWNNQSNVGLPSASKQLKHKKTKSDKIKPY